MTIRNYITCLLIPNKPAALENSNTSPLGTFLFFIASIVSCWETETIAVAIALRRLFDFDVMSTHLANYLFSFQ